MTFLSANGQSLRNGLDRRLTKLMLKQDWDQFYAGYQEAMEHTAIRSCGENALANENAWTKTCSESGLQFAKRAAAAIEAGCGRVHPKTVLGRRPERFYATWIREHVDWPTEMRFEGDAQFFQDQQQRVAEAQDRFLYERFRKLRTEDAANAYLVGREPGAMKMDVKKYRDYLEAQKQKHSFTIVLEAIEWPEDYPEDDDNVIRFEVDGHVAKEVKEVESKPSRKTGEIGRFPLNGERLLSSSVKLKVEITNVESLLWIDWVWRDATGGNGSETVKLSHLDGYRQKLKAGKWGQCVAHYRLIGVPQEPALPPWRRQ